MHATSKLGFFLYSERTSENDSSSRKPSCLVASRPIDSETLAMYNRSKANNRRLVG